MFNIFILVFLQPLHRKDLSLKRPFAWPLKAFCAFEMIPDSICTLYWILNVGRAENTGQDMNFWQSSRFSRDIHIRIQRIFESIFISNTLQLEVVQQKNNNDHRDVGITARAA